MARAVTCYPAHDRAESDRPREFARFADRETGRPLDLFAIVEATPARTKRVTSYAVFADSEGRVDRLVWLSEIGRSIVVRPLPTARERARAVLSEAR